MSIKSNDHELMRMIQKRVNQKPSIPMSQIAAELGFGVDELCEFIMAYKGLADTKKDGPSIAEGWDVHEHERRYAAWKRQHDGAALARLAVENSRGLTTSESRSMHGLSPENSRVRA